MLFKGEVGSGYDVLSLSTIYPAQSFQNMLPPWYVNNDIEPKISLAEFFCPQITQMRFEEIDKRNVVLIKFSEFPKQVLKAIGQVSDLNILHDIAFLGEYAIYLGPAVFVNTSRVMPIGFWNYRSFGTASSQFTYGFDIVSLYSHIYGIKYNDSINILFDYLDSKSFDSNGTRGYKKRFYVQERNPLSHIRFATKDIDYLCLHGADGADFKYYNKYGYLMFAGFLYKCKDGNKFKTFYTVCRHVNSQMLYVLPIFPDSPYPVYGIDRFSGREIIFFVDDEIEADYLNSICGDMSLGFVTCPKGVEGVFDIDLALIKNTSLVLDLSFCAVDIEKLWQLKHKCVKFNVNLYFNLDNKCDQFISLIKERYGCFTLLEDQKISRYSFVQAENFFKNPELYNKFNLKNIDLGLLREDDLGIFKGSMPLPGADKKRAMILDPIIEEGTITWLFAAEKAGKTWMGLTIAYAVGKGNRPVGRWESREKFPVLYIDGEMPVDKLNIMIKKIGNGYQDECLEEQRPFDIISFYQNDQGYGSIMSEVCKNKYEKIMSKYKLVILDNYYSLNGNSQNSIPFIRWLKNMTKKDISFIVLDHTNSSEELQGSVVKRRALDLGIHIERLQDNEVNISMPFSRYLDSKDQDSYRVKALFTSLSFSYEALEESEQDVVRDISNKLRAYAAVLVLKEKFHYENDVIGNIIGRSKGSVDNYINAFKTGVTESQKKNAPKLKSKERSLVMEEKGRLSLFSKDDLLDYAKGLLGKK